MQGDSTVLDNSNHFDTLVDEYTQTSLKEDGAYAEAEQQEIPACYESITFILQVD